MNCEYLGSRIAQLRKERGMSQAELAEKANLTVVYVSYIENAKRTPGLDSVKKIAKALSVPVSALFPECQYDEFVVCAKNVNDILRDCSEEERLVLVDMLSAIKHVMRKHQ